MTRQHDLAARNRRAGRTTGTGTDIRSVARRFAEVRGGSRRPGKRMPLPNHIAVAHRWPDGVETGELAGGQIAHTRVGGLLHRRTLSFTRRSRRQPRSCAPPRPGAILARHGWPPRGGNAGLSQGAVGVGPRGEIDEPPGQGRAVAPARVGGRLLLLRASRKHDCIAWPSSSMRTRCYSLSAIRTFRRG